RMRQAVTLLADDDSALYVFCLVNDVMLRQQYHSRLRRKLDDAWLPLPKTRSNYSSEWGATARGYWRHFQLGFLLMTLPGLIEDSPPVTCDGVTTCGRDVVDLIWFPTGGGKTEAYLAVAAFAIFWTRLNQPGRTGCRVLMRYTLRLLTSQQF